MSYPFIISFIIRKDNNDITKHKKKKREKIRKEKKKKVVILRGVSTIVNQSELILNLDPSNGFI